MKKPSESINEEPTLVPGALIGGEPWPEPVHIPPIVLEPRPGFDPKNVVKAEAAAPTRKPIPPVERVRELEVALGEAVMALRRLAPTCTNSVERTNARQAAIDAETILRR